MSSPILSQPQTITQFSLARYASLTAQIETLKDEHSALQKQLMADLGSGATTEPGASSASLKTCERRSVSWRSVVERLKGAGYASRILSCTKPTTYTKLVVR